MATQHKKALSFCVRNRERGRGGGCTSVSKRAGAPAESPHKDRVAPSETSFQVPGGEICSKNREIILLVLLTTQSFETMPVVGSAWPPTIFLIKKMRIPRKILLSMTRSFCEFSLCRCCRRRDPPYSSPLRGQHRKEQNTKQNTPHGAADETQHAVPSTSCSYTRVLV